MRREQVQTCNVVHDLVADVNSRLWWVASEQAATRSALPAAADLIAAREVVEQLQTMAEGEAGLHVNLRSQAADLQVAAPEGVEVTNPPDLAPVKSSIDAGTETSNQNIWAGLGLVVAGLFLFALYRIFRPS